MEVQRKKSQPEINVTLVTQGGVIDASPGECDHPPFLHLFQELVDVLLLRKDELVWGLTEKPDNILSY